VLRRHALVEASWSVVRQPGPLRAFYQRIRNDAMRRAERELALQAERAYQRTIADWHAITATKGASATPGRASQGRQSSKQRGKASVPNPAP
jgi:hypothetical protein